MLLQALTEIRSDDDYYWGLFGQKDQQFVRQGEIMLND